MKPLLAHVFDPSRFHPPAYVQPKFNGVRALYQQGHFQSRDEMPWNTNVLAHLAKPLREIFDDKTVLDGELYVHGWPLQRINGAVAINRSEPREDTHEVEYRIFDVVSYISTFEERFKMLLNNRHWFAGTKLHVAETKYVTMLQEADEFYMKCVADGYEGIMYRLQSCPYTMPKQEDMQLSALKLRFKLRSKWLSDKDNRVWHLLKRKDWLDGEFVCLRIEEGEGKRRGMVGAFICQAPTNTFKVGSGLTDDEARHYFTNPPIGHRIKVKFLTWTTEGKPFNPTVEAVF